MNDEIRKAVDALPEVYQVIYGHPELSEKTSRTCLDRWQVLERVVKNLQHYLGRKELKILDIGCAQGFYSLSFAKMGCIVRGIDGNPENIRLCQLLCEENDLPNCSFEETYLTPDYAEQNTEKYDVIFTLSVMHHVAIQNGFAAARKIFEKLAGSSEIIISEMALKEEPVYWNIHLPDSCDEWFSHIRFFDEVTYFGTHLSEVRRPLIVSSNHLLYLKEKFYPIDTYSNKSYDEKKEDSAKRFYRSGEWFIKLIRSLNEAGKKELETEISFILENPDISFLNGITDSDISEKRAYSIRPFIQGRLLSDMIRDGQECQWDLVFESILGQLTELEAHGYYHGDLRPWNVICDPDRHQGFLIDYGNIKRNPQDDVADMIFRALSRTSGFTVYDAFAALVYDTLTHKKYPYITSYEIYDPEIFFRLSLLEKRYQNFFKAYILNRDSIDYCEIDKLFQHYVIRQEKADFSAEEERRVQESLMGRLYEKVMPRIDAYVETQKRDQERMALEDRLEQLLLQKAQSQGMVDKLSEQVQGMADKLSEQVQGMADEMAAQKAQIENLISQEEQNRTRIKELKTENKALREEIQILNNWIVLRVYRKLRDLKS